MTLEFFGLNLRVGRGKKRKKQRNKEKKSMKQNEDSAAGPAVWLQSAKDSGANHSDLGLACEPDPWPTEGS